MHDYCRQNGGTSIDLSGQLGWIWEAFSRSCARSQFGDGRASIPCWFANYEAEQ